MRIKANLRLLKRRGWLSGQYGAKVIKRFFVGLPLGDVFHNESLEIRGVCYKTAINVVS